MNVLRRLFRKPVTHDMTPVQAAVCVPLGDPLACERLEEIRSRLDYVPKIPFHRDAEHKVRRQAG